MGGNSGIKRARIGSKKRRRFRRFWGKLCVDMYQRMLAYALRLVNGDQDRAAVLVQTTTTRALTYCRNPAKIKNPKGYLFATIRNEWIRARDEGIEVSFDTINETELKENSVTKSEWTMELFELREALDGLKARAGIDADEFDKMLDLFVKGLTFEEVARELGQDVKKTRSRWYGYLDQIKKQLKKEAAELEARANRAA